MQNDTDYDNNTDYDMGSLADFVRSDVLTIGRYQQELQESSLGDSLHEKARHIPEFANADLRKLDSFSLFRTMLYVIVRALRPRLFIETGVLHGFSSAFILQAMHDNGLGQLVSIDLPSRGLKLAHEGTGELPSGCTVGWGIPDTLRGRHRLHLGPSQRILPELLSQGVVPDVFMHDSLHTYNHIMMELSLVRSFMEPNTLVICDNIELNNAFSDFSRGNDLEHLGLASFDRPDRVWKHGLAWQ